MARTEERKRASRRLQIRNGEAKVKQDSITIKQLADLRATGHVAHIYSKVVCADGFRYYRLTGKVEAKR
jgi:hypothetical protein